MNDLISISVEDLVGNKKTIDIPTDINLSLMEILKASDYDIAATCGGMALCATCHIEVLNGIEKLNQPTDAELDMLDTLPVVTSSSRLACQIKIKNELNGLSIRLRQ